MRRIHTVSNFQGGEKDTSEESNIVKMTGLMAKIGQKDWAL